MVIAKAAPAACGSELRVPNVLFRIWTGVCCPPLLDFVSLLVAVLQLSSSVQNALSICSRRECLQTSLPFEDLMAKWAVVSQPWEM